MQHCCHPSFRSIKTNIGDSLDVIVRIRTQVGVEVIPEVLEINSWTRTPIFSISASFIPCALQLEDDLKGELDFSRGGGCPGQESGYASWGARWIEDVGIVGGDRRCEVRAIEHVKHFGTELNVEGFGNFADVVVLEYREINVQQAR
jgi:hypothetical protein